MGWRYVAFRAWYEFKRKSGLLKRTFPLYATTVDFIGLNEWRSLPVKFFFDGKESAFSSSDFLLTANDPEVLNQLERKFSAFQRGELLFYGAKWVTVKDWHTHPETGYRYGQTVHWSEIPDFSAEAGDIKYVWEKGRFTFLFDLIRYDHHFQFDAAETVFGEIESWIKANPVNQGPHWRCSQEISLRVLNWTFALQYFKNSQQLTPGRLHLILNSIWRQMQHVEKNIDFSRIAVRNNHALTETLALYLVGLLYPFFPESEVWRLKGKRWFEEEIAYQVYDDGSYLQFSMNYHRVVVQLMTWAIGLARCNGEKWSDMTYAKARKSLDFLMAFQNRGNGWLPNYGTNDGALFFPMSGSHFRDFRPQIGALASLLNLDPGYPEGSWDEDKWWISGRDQAVKPSGVSKVPVSGRSFDSGGYFTLSDSNTFTFIRCGSYRHRPFQADNLHLDITVDGVNILRDAGTYGYNTDSEIRDFFTGSEGHNTVKVGRFEQMTRGPRFIWTDWIKKAQGSWTKVGHDHVFTGSFQGFCRAGKGIVHLRKVRKYSGVEHWTIEDELQGLPAQLPIHQMWHPEDNFFSSFTLRAWDKEGNALIPEKRVGWYSELYGQKVEAPYYVFTAYNGCIRTEIVKSSNAGSDL